MALSKRSLLSPTRRVSSSDSANAVPLMASGWFVASDASSSAASCAAWSSCMFLLSTEHPTPPGPLCALLSPSRSGPGLCPLRHLLDRLRGFWDLSETVQLLAQLVALPLGLFASPALLGHPLVQRGLRHLTAGTFGAELFLDLSQLVGRAGTHFGFSRRSKGLKLSA